MAGVEMRCEDQRQEVLGWTLLWERKIFASTLLDSVTGDMQIKLTRDILTGGKKGLFVCITKGANGKIKLETYKLDITYNMDKVRDLYT